MHYLEMCTILYAWVTWDEGDDSQPVIFGPEVLDRPAFRAARLANDDAGDTERLLYLFFPSKSRPRQRKPFLNRILKSGIDIGGKMYKFLGITEPSIKEGYIILFNESPDMSAKKFLGSLGDLEDVYIKSGAGKFAARLGLSFSSTVKAAEILPEQMLKIPDQELDDGTKTTDGCAFIRESWAKEFLQEIGISDGTKVIHVRIGGIKGLLVVYQDNIFDFICNETRGTKSKYNLTYRPSMFKYSGGPHWLEVNNVSQPSAPARFNNAFVILLLTMDRRLLEPLKALLSRHVDDIKAITQDKETALAHFERVVKDDEDAGPGNYYLKVYEMLKAGHDLSEPQLGLYLHRYQRQHFDALRGSMKFTVPKSRYLYGIVDELNELADGNVYVCISDAGVIEGNILVSRNPCYLPSDIRVLKAVKSKRHACSGLKDCIVFPKVGFTSIPNLMGGGDLDGDKYFVCWDKTIVPDPSYVKSPESDTLTPNSAPASSGARDIRNLAIDCVDVFNRLFRSTLLGTVSKEWQDKVEHDPKLADGDYPKKLARIVAVALDLTKTNADYEKLEDYFEDLKIEFRVSCEANAWLPSPVDKLREIIPILSLYKKPSPFPIDGQLVLRNSNADAFQKFYSEGEEVMKSFNRRLRRIVEEKKEENLIREQKSFPYLPKKKIDKGDELRAAFRAKYFADNEMSHSELLLRASAWYCVAYERQKVEFAWLGSQFLNELKSRQSSPPLLMAKRLRVEDQDAELAETLHGLGLIEGEERQPRTRTRKVRPDARISRRRKSYSRSTTESSWPRSWSRSRSRFTPGNRPGDDEGPEPYLQSISKSIEYVMVFGLMVVGVLATRFSL